MTVAVVGAGPTGLAAAWHLARAGHDVVVLEATDRLGGTAGARTVAGQRVDLVPAGFGADLAEDVRAELASLVAVDPVSGQQLVRVCDHWVPFPGVRPPWRDLPLRAAVRSALEAVSGSLRRSPAAPATLAEAVRVEVGPTMARRVHEPLARKVWGDGAGDLVARLGAPLLAETAPAPTWQPAGGGALIDAMAAPVGDIRLGTRVVSLGDGPGGVRIGVANGATLRADHVLSTMGVAKTAAMLGLVRPSQVHVEHRALIVVLMVTEATAPGTDVHLLADEHLLPWRVSETLGVPEDPADRARAVRRAEVLCTVGDDVWNAPDDVLGHRVADDLVRAGLPDPGRVVVGTARFPAVYPVLDPAAATALATAASAMTRAPHVTVIGRQDRSPFGLDHVPYELGFAAAERTRAALRG